jgi:hypothetical protein
LKNNCFGLALTCGCAEMQRRVGQYNDRIEARNVDMRDSSLCFSIINFDVNV